MVSVFVIFIIRMVSVKHGVDNIDAYVITRKIIEMVSIRAISII